MFYFIMEMNTFLYLLDTQYIYERKVRRNQNDVEPFEIPGTKLDHLRRLKNGKFSIGTKWLHQASLLIVSLGQSS